MHRHVSIGLAALLLLAPATASAERYKSAFGAGVAHATRGSLWGGAVSGDWVLTDGVVDASAAGDTEWLISAIAEASFATGTRDGSDLSQGDLLVGPRYTQVGYGTPWRVQPFVQALVGTLREDSASAGHTALAGAFGIGLDIPLGPLQSAARRKSVVLRAQYAEHWVNEDKTDWYGQWSASLVVRFTRSR
jgi:hypothetical protein